MPTDQELDRMIDAALPGYSATEPLAGLEDRILNRTLAKSASVSRHAWTWAIGVFACACLLLLLILPNPRHFPHSISPAASSSAKSHSSPSQAELARAKVLTAPVRESHARSISVRVSAPKSLPKQDTFPSSAPLTAEEERLIAYRQSHLPPATPAIDPTLALNPIRIAELQIKPLDIPALEPPYTNFVEAGPIDRQP